MAARQRNVEIVINGAMPIDGFKAVLQKVQEYENDLDQGREIPVISSVGGDPSLTAVLTSLKQHEVYVVDFADIDPELGNYTVEVVSVGL